jgi:hypothetical protein
MQIGARYYDPTTGSFLTRDTDLNQLAYVYCGDDPIDKLDPSGHSWNDVTQVFKDIIIIGGITVASAMVPEAAPVIIDIGLGALAGSMVAANDYYYTTTFEDWDNGQLDTTVIKGGIIGGASGWMALPTVGKEIRNILKIPGE